LQGLGELFAIEGESPEVTICATFEKLESGANDLYQSGKIATISLTATALDSQAELKWPLFDGRYGADTGE
jgi:hypothetical protein